MLLKPLSIQQALRLALIVLSGLVFVTVVVAVLAFSRIADTQNQWVSITLPSLEETQQLVVLGEDLLIIGEALSSPVTESELLSYEEELASLLRLWDNMSVDNIINTGQAGLLVVEDKNQLVDIIRRQLNIQQQYLLAEPELINSKSELLSGISPLLTDIKLLSAELSFELLTGEFSLNITEQQSVLSSLRFDIQEVVSIVERSALINQPLQVDQLVEDYRLQLRKIAAGFLELRPEDQSVLADGMVFMNNVLLEDQTFFSQLKSQFLLLEEMSAVHQEVLLINQQLVNHYQALVENSNNYLDREAESVLTIINRSQLLLWVVSFFALLIAILFSFFFIRPKVIERLQRLNENTQAISRGNYQVDIDIKGEDEISAMAQSLAYFRNELLEKEQVQGMLDDRTKRLATITDNTAEAMLTVTVKGIIEDVNQSAIRLFNMEEADIYSIDQCFPQDVSVFRHHTLQAPSADGAGLSVCEQKLVHAKKIDGQDFYAKLSVSLINLSGRTIYSVFAQDVTQEHQAREKEAALVEELSASNAELERFAYSCSHDLQEPIRIILSFSQLLKEELGNDLNENTARYMEYIEQNAANAKALIKDVLDYSRLDQSSIEKVSVSLNHLCERVNDSLVVMIEEKGGKLEWPEENVVVKGVETQLFQLLLNLVTNGLKYNQSQKPKVSVTVDNNNKDYWVINVSDNGIGMEQRYYDQIFEVFSRLVSRQQYAGSGIGLAICRKIAEKHGGYIQVESTVGKGSCFLVYLAKG